MQEERRRFVRLSALVDIVYDKRDSLKHKKLTLAKNIGRGGICLIVYEELKKSDLLDLKIYLPESKTPINAVGRVVWVKEFIIGDISTGRRFDAGIEFIEIDKEDAKIIEKYIFSVIL